MLRLLPVLWTTLCLVGCQERGRLVLLLVDQDAGGKEHPGAIFRIDPVTKKVELFATSPLFRRPQDILQLEDRSFLVLDFFEDGGVGKIFWLAADGKKCEELKLPPGLVDPYHFERAPDGSILIVDRDADPLGLGRKAKKDTGTLWRLSADLQTLEVVATGPPLAVPSAVLCAGGKTYLMDADAYQVLPFKLENDEGAIFEVVETKQRPAKLKLIVKFKGLVSPLGVHRESSGAFLVVDVNADPVKREELRGAVYRVDPAKGTTELFVRHKDFRDPLTCLLFEGSLLVVDANADPLGLGDDGTLHHYGGVGRGAVYRVDLKTKTAELFVASKHFVNPVRIRKVRL